MLSSLNQCFIQSWEHPEAHRRQLSPYISGTSAISLYSCPVWQAWLHTFWTQQSFCLAEHVHLGQCTWHPRRHGWGSLRPGTCTCTPHPWPGRDSFRPLQVTAGLSGQLPLPPRRLTPGTAPRMRHRAGGHSPQNRGAGRGAGADRGTASGSPCSPGSRGYPAGCPSPAVPLLPRGEGAGCGETPRGLPVTMAISGRYRGAGAVPRSGVPRGGARGATAPRYRSQSRPRQPRSPAAPPRALRPEGRRRPPSVPSPPGWREGGGAGGGGRRGGGWPGSGGGQLPPGLGGVRPRGSAAGCAGGSRGPGGGAGAGGGGFFFWGGEDEWGENGDCRLRLFLSSSRGSRIAAAAAAAAARRERGAEGCGALGEAGSSGSSLLPSWWPWCAAPRGRSQRAPAAAARDAFLQGSKLMRSPRPPPPAPLPPSPLAPRTPASASPARHPRLFLPTVWTIPATCPSWKKLWINCWKATTSASDRISEVSRPARAGRPAMSPSPAAVPGAAAAPARRLRPSRPPALPRHLSPPAKRSALPAGPPVCVGMNIDIASIDMVSEVNMVSGGRARPAPGLSPGSRPPVSRPSFLTKSPLSRRAVAGLRGAPSAALFAWKLYFPGDALSSFPPLPLSLPAAVSGSVPGRRFAPSRLLLLL